MSRLKISLGFYLLMMRLKVFNIILIIFLTSNIQLLGQNNFIFGYIKHSQTKQSIPNTEIYEYGGKLLAISNKYGYYEFYTNNDSIELTYFSLSFSPSTEKIILHKKSLQLDKYLDPISINLKSININEYKNRLFKIERLNDITEDAIYAGKKSEVILLKNSPINLSTNNARQIYSQITGLNIYENDDAGIQLNIGGRGLDPNRTSNFNTKQNSYDISADVLGYPESYYTPPSEALERIEIVRGAAALQYGSQFGGLINFVLKKPTHNKKIEIITRNTIGNNNLYTNFTSGSGNNKNLKYYSFFNYKKGDGFRDNSEFESKNLFTYIEWNINKKIKFSSEFTFMNYLAQQAGGLTDNMFKKNPLQSNRKRNWFSVSWLLYNIKLSHKITTKTNHIINIYTLKANRFALGFRSNRVYQIDNGSERDLIKGYFNNFGGEYRIIHKDSLFGKKITSLIGAKIYASNNSSEQGPGSNLSDADFNFQYDKYPYYINSSSYKYPNINIAIFKENILYINKKLSLVPGLRFEHIRTESNGYYSKINLDGANNVIYDTIIEENRINDRKFILAGIGFSYKMKLNEVYSNISQNYRSVTFSDISIINPAYIIDPNISDESGYTMDIGVRGKIKNIIYYDITSFRLRYKNRIGFTQVITEDGNIKSQRGNVGDAVIYGLESLLEINLRKILPPQYKLSSYLNTSFITSKYLKSQSIGIEGNYVEFVPKLNLKTGLDFGYKRINTNLQYTFVGDQYTDASNAEASNLSGIIGKIPAYSILDLGGSYRINNYKIEIGINNILNKNYFTRRATGYPGPGIIPSQPRNYYFSLEVKI